MHVRCQRARSACGRVQAYQELHESSYVLQIIAMYIALLDLILNTTRDYRSDSLGYEYKLLAISLQ